MAKVLLPKTAPIASKPAVLAGAIVFTTAVLGVMALQGYATIRRAAAEQIPEEVRSVAEDTNRGFELADELQGEVLPEFSEAYGGMERLERQRSMIELRDELAAIVEEMGRRINMNKYQQLPVAEETETYGEETE